MRLYKLTDEKMETFNSFKWELNKKYSLPEKENPELCSKDVFHAYKSLDLGLVFNPIHAVFKNPRLFECEGNICVEDFDKVGTFSLTLEKEIKLPEWYVNEETRKKILVQFAILCAEEVLPLYTGESNAPRLAIEAAKECLSNPCEETRVKAWIKANAAEEAAEEAARAAYAAAWVASAARAAADAARWAARSAIWAAARAAARAAAYAAAYAASIKDNINFEKLLKKSVDRILSKNTDINI